MTISTAILTDFAATARGDEVTISAQLRHHGEGRQVFFRIVGEQEAVFMPSAAPFLVGLLWPLMRQGLSVRLDAPVDADLLYQIENELMPLLISTEHRLSPIEISAPSVSSSPSADAGTGAATGMSCGLDSLMTLMESKSVDCPPSRRIERFLFHDFGGHGKGSPGKVHLDRLSRARSVARAEGVPLLEIVSNLGEFYQDGFERTHTLRNAAAAFNVSSIVQSGSAPSRGGVSRLILGVSRRC